MYTVYSKYNVCILTLFLQGVLFSKLKILNVAIKFSFHFPHRLFGETDYLSIILGMQKDYPKPNGHIYFSDPRLASNGFLIKMMPGTVCGKFYV